MGVEPWTIGLGSLSSLIFAGVWTNNHIGREADKVTGPQYGDHGYSEKSVPTGSASRWNPRPSCTAGTITNAIRSTSAEFRPQRLPTGIHRVYFPPNGHSEIAGRAVPRTNNHPWKIISGRRWVTLQKTVPMPQHVTMPNDYRTIGSGSVERPRARMNGSGATCGCLTLDARSTLSAGTGIAPMSADQPYCGWTM